MRAAVLLPLLAHLGASAPHHPSSASDKPFKHDPSIDLSGPAPHDHHHIESIKQTYSKLDSKPHHTDPHPSPHADHIPTSRESAVLARRILALTPIGTLSTVFPGSKSSPSEKDASSFFAHEVASAHAPHRRPEDIAGVPIGMMDYISDCEDTFSAAPEGNPTILAISIATAFRNVAAGSNISLSLAWTPPYAPSKRIRSYHSLGGIAKFIRGLFGSGDKEQGRDDEGEHDPMPYSAANLPRFALLGTIEKIDFGSSEAGALVEDAEAESKEKKLAECFVRAHPDAKYWLPGNRIHRSEWVRLRVNEVYWVGGFGDRAYIGWIPIGEWRGVKKEEWEGVRLPGEKKGWKEWTVGEL